VFAFLVLLLASPMIGLAQDPGWPRQRVDNGNTLVTYQPQVDDWKNFQELDWRMAFTLTPKGGQQTVGIAVMRRNTTIDNDAQVVLITNPTVVETHYPALDPDCAAQMDRLLRTILTPAISISLHRVLASVPKKESPSGVQLNNEPPAIFVSYAP